MACRTLARKAARRRTPRACLHSTRTHSRGRWLYRRPLRLEPLEDRRLLAVVTVDTLADTVDFNDGVTSLREAIFATNTVPGADTIEFAPSLTAAGPATILLTQGELRITDSLTINGPGAELLTIDASGNDPTPDENNGDGSRVFYIDNLPLDADRDVSISGLTLTGGDTMERGGAVSNRENLDLSNSVVVGNYAMSGGGGISSGGFSRTKGSLTLLGSVVRENSVLGIGGGISIVGDSLTITNSTIENNAVANSGSLGGQGGGIFALSSQITVAGSTIRGNESQREGGGISGEGGSLHVVDSLVSDNSAGVGRTLRGGGGIAFVASSDFEVVDSTISGNSAGGTGGGIAAWYLSIRGSEIVGNSTLLNGGGLSVTHELTVTDSLITENDAAATGGGIAASASIPTQTTISGSTISGNISHGSVSFTERGGGGIVNHGNMTIIGSTIAGNVAEGEQGSGGGIRNEAFLTIIDSTVSGNSAAYGGGVADRRNMRILGSTLSGNTAVVGGGAFVFGSDEHRIDHSTIAFNSATGVGNGFFIQAGSLQLNHSILAENSGSMVGDATVVVDASLVPTYSLVGRAIGTGLAEAPVGSPDANGNLIGRSLLGGRGIDPLVGPLADNGGQTMTHALLEGSPAINAGDPNAQAGVDGVPVHDQRGEPFGRVVGGRIDIGAFEFQEPADLNLLVDTLADESDGDYSRGDLSLREAIELANANVYKGVVDTIRFDPALTAAGPATILLTQGELAITDSLTINGPGAELLTIDASGNDPTPDENNGDGSRVFNIYDGNLMSTRDVNLVGLTLTGGDVAGDGGAIFASENLNLIDGAVRGNFATRNGGGIFSISVFDFGGDLAIARSTVNENTSRRDGGGVYRRGGGMIVVDSAIGGNSARYGGGIYTARSSTPTTITGSQILNNEARNNGGGLYGLQNQIEVRDSIVKNNTAGRYGGGITANGGEIKIIRAVIDDNSAGRGGGGISSFGSLAVTDSTITSNSAHGGLSWYATGGGGIVSSGGLVVTDSTITGNWSRSFGGGILSGNTVTVTDSTISRNSALLGGGVYGDGTFEFNTITDNDGGGIRGNADLNHTIVAGNRATDGSALDVAGTVTAHFSLVGFGAEFLGPLADNGGPTLPDGSKMLTHALLPGSPAINAGDPNAQAGVGGVPAHDQRGAPFTRVYRGRIDIGAVEAQPVDVLAGDYNGDGVVDAADYSTWRDALGQAVVAGSGADGNGDGVVDTWDHRLWAANFGATAADLPPGAASGASEQGSAEGLQVETSRGTVPFFFADSEKSGKSPIRQTKMGAGPVFARRAVRFDAGVQDNALLAWLASRRGTVQRPADDPDVAGYADRAADEPIDALLDAVDAVFGAVLAGGLQ